MLLSKSPGPKCDINHSTKDNLITALKKKIMLTTNLRNLNKIEGPFCITQTTKSFCDLPKSSENKRYIPYILIHTMLLLSEMVQVQTGMNKLE